RVTMGGGGNGERLPTPMAVSRARMIPTHAADAGPGAMHPPAASTRTRSREWTGNVLHAHSGAADEHDRAGWTFAPSAMTVQAHSRAPPAADCRDRMHMKHNAFLASLAAVVVMLCSAHLPARAAGAPAEPLHLVPVPQSLEIRSGALEFSSPVGLDIDAAAPNAARALKAALDGLGIATSDAATTRVRLQLTDDAALGEEGYRLVVADDIELSARSDAGLLHAVQTLRQLLPASAQRQLVLPHVEIVDAPAYRWRGLSLDVARSFLPVEYIEKTLDRMAFFKLNRLHLHLTDDQGWRI